VVVKPVALRVIKIREVDRVDRQLHRRAELLGQLRAVGRRIVAARHAGVLNHGQKVGRQLHRATVRGLAVGFQHIPQAELGPQTVGVKDVLHSSAAGGVVHETIGQGQACVDRTDDVLEMPRKRRSKREHLQPALIPLRPEGVVGALDGDQAAAVVGVKRGAVIRIGQAGIRRLDQTFPNGLVALAEHDGLTVMLGIVHPSARVIGPRISGGDR